QTHIPARQEQAVRPDASESSPCESISLACLLAAIGRPDTASVPRGGVRVHDALDLGADQVEEVGVSEAQRMTHFVRYGVDAMVSKSESSHTTRNYPFRLDSLLCPHNTAELSAQGRLSGHVIG